MTFRSSTLRSAVAGALALGLSGPGAFAACAPCAPRKSTTEKAQNPGAAKANPCAAGKASPCAAKKANPHAAKKPDAAMSNKAKPCAAGNPSAMKKVDAPVAMNPCAAKANPCGAKRPCAPKK
ncbi:MAG TPA: hypothetical protein VKT00_08345 [Casimicrobiaceae bacterium]|nr:hypothetical protein [Casimicrobiaceae bacterium]